MKKYKIKDVKHRKDSESFQDWMKFEITVINDDGTEDIIPAYGKDAKDAISRISHDIRVNQMSKMVKRVPQGIAVILWFIYIGLFSFWANTSNEWQILIIGLGALLVIGTIWAFWSRKRSVDK